MKILRVIHGLANNVMDCQVEDNFDVLRFARDMHHDGYLVSGRFYVNVQWVQNAGLFTPEELTQLSTQGMTKQ